MTLIVDLKRLEDEDISIVHSEAGEALGLELKHLADDCRTIIVEQSSWQGAIQTPKTDSVYRQVDLSPDLASLLILFVAGRQPGLLFSNKADRPLAQTNLLRRSLHPILKSLGVDKAGFHAMRRYRTTWLRKQRAPEDLIKFWPGHSETSVAESYSKLADDVESRKQVAEAVGTDFAVSAHVAKIMRPKRPRKSDERTVAVAA